MRDFSNWSLSRAELVSLLDYDQHTGKFVWKVTRGGLAKEGSPAGAIEGNGYINVRVHRRLIKSHRLAWLYVYGVWPSKDLDHINGDKTDNRIENLREATRPQNVANSIVRRDSKIGLKGVRLAGGCKRRWIARITEHGKRRIIGRYSSPEAAYAAYCEAAAKHFGQFAKVVNG